MIKTMIPDLGANKKAPRLVLRSLRTMTTDRNIDLNLISFEQVKTRYVSNLTNPEATGSLLINQTSQLTAIFSRSCQLNDLDHHPLTGCFWYVKQLLSDQPTLIEWFDWDQVRSQGEIVLTSTDRYMATNELVQTSRVNNPLIKDQDWSRFPFRPFRFWIYHQYPPARHLPGLPTLFISVRKLS